MITLALIIPMAYLWRLVRARPLAEALLRWAGKDQPSKRTFRVVVAAVAFPVAVWLALAVGRWTDLAPMDRSGYAWGALALSTALAFAHLVHERRKRLTVAGATLSSVARGLRDARGDSSRLAVRVRADAPTVARPAHGKPRAQLRPQRSSPSPSPGETPRHRHRPRFTRQPAWCQWKKPRRGIPLPSTADLDLRACSQRGARPRGALTELAEALRDLPDPTPTPPSSSSERFLEPGEQLSCSAVQRIEPAQRQGNYRDAGTAPSSGQAGRGHEGHAGTELSLVRSLMLERRVVDAMLALMLLTAVAVVAANVAMALQ